MDEVGDRFLVGPLEVSSLEAGTTLSRRFGIQQASKVRCVDDFSMSSVNSAVQCFESPCSHTVDVFAAMCVELMRKHVFVSGEA